MQRTTATIVKCAVGGFGKYADIITLFDDQQRFHINALPNGVFNGLLTAYRDSGCELLYQICGCIQRTLRLSYVPPLGLLCWEDVTQSNTSYILSDQIFIPIENALMAEMCPFLGDNVDSMRFEDAAIICITAWKDPALFDSNDPPIVPKYSTFTRLAYFEIRGPFDYATNASGPSSSIFIALSTRGSHEYFGFYVADSLPALRHLIQLQFRCRDISMTRDVHSPWYAHMIAAH